MLLSRFNSELNKFVVELIDLTNFQRLHSWHPDIESLNKLVNTEAIEYQNYLLERNKKRFRIMHPLLGKDGSIVYHGAHTPLIKINFCIELIWMYQVHIFHHSIEKDSNGNIWTSGTSFPFSLQEKLTGPDPSNFSEDTIYQISPDGEILYNKSIPQIFFENDLDYLLTSIGSKFLIDPIHVNDIQPVLEDGLFWKKGDLFLSLRHQSMIILLDQKKIN